MDQATVQEIKGFFQEIRDLYRETDLRMKETDRQMKETDRIMREKRENSEREFEKLRQVMQEQSRETDRKFQETDRKFQETDRKFQETREIIKETSRKVGALSNRLGEFVEEMVRPGVEELFQGRGVDVHSQIGPMKASDADGGIQVDLAVGNTTEMVLIECKSKLSEDDVNDHLERLAKFKKYFPEYADKQLMGAVAAMIIPEDVARYAYRKGLFVMAQSGDMMVILNDEKFVPGIF